MARASAPRAMRGTATHAQPAEGMNLQKVFIATPTAGGIVTVAYASTLIATTIALRKRNVGYRYTNFDGSDIVVARNYLANTFLQDKACSHILFVDSDMAVSQELIGKLLDSQKEFIGTIYPERKIDLEAFGSYLLKGYSHKGALASSMRYNIKHFAKDVVIENGMCRVRACGFGCVLIAKPVFEKLIQFQRVGKFVSSLMQRAGYAGEAYDFFGEIAQENGDCLSEDYSFCERVHQLAANEIWAVIGDPVGHVGQFTYGAPYVDKIAAPHEARSRAPTLKIAKQ